MLPCREEHSDVNEFNLKIESSIKLIGLNYKDKPKNAKNFIKDFWKSLFSLIITDDRWNNSYRVGGIWCT